jgi:hypothetical protein
MYFNRNSVFRRFILKDMKMYLVINLAIFLHVPDIFMRRQMDCSYFKDINGKLYNTFIFTFKKIFTSLNIGRCPPAKPLKM